MCCAPRTRQCGIRPSGICIEHLVLHCFYGICMRYPSSADVTRSCTKRYTSAPMWYNFFASFLLLNCIIVPSTAFQPQLSIPSSMMVCQYRISNILKLVRHDYQTNVPKAVHLSDLGILQKCEHVFCRLKTYSDSMFHHHAYLHIGIWDARCYLNNDGVYVIICLTLIDEYMCPYTSIKGLHQLSVN